MADSCQHCGDRHFGLPACPRTGDRMSLPGRCGTRIDRYLIERLLGVGAFGSVYQARHLRTEAAVALKLLKQELMADDAALERFIREARTAAAVADEHVVRVLDAEVTSEKVAFIAMELLEGHDLKEIARRERPLHPSRVVQLLAQVLDGLAAAHDKGVIHRDIKPANIFIVRRKHPGGAEYEFAKLLDFGISKMESSTATPLTLTGATLGTPNYMAWEQFFDPRQVDPRTDLYAISVILYELLGGRKPYEAAGTAALVEQVRLGGAPPLRSLAPSLPVPLCAVVDKGLATRPARRWSTAREFAAALRQAVLLTGEPPALIPKEREAVVLEMRADPAPDQLPGTLVREPLGEATREIETILVPPPDQTRDRDP